MDTEPGESGYSGEEQPSGDEEECGGSDKFSDDDANLDNMFGGGGRTRRKSLQITDKGAQKHVRVALNKLAQEKVPYAWMYEALAEVLKKGALLDPSQIAAMDTLEKTIRNHEDEEGEGWQQSDSDEDGEGGGGRIPDDEQGSDNNGNNVENDDDDIGTCCFSCVRYVQVTVGEPRYVQVTVGEPIMFYPL